MCDVPLPFWLKAVIVQGLLALFALRISRCAGARVGCTLSSGVPVVSGESVCGRFASDGVIRMNNNNSAEYVDQWGNVRKYCNRFRESMQCGFGAKCKFAH